MSPKLLGDNKHLSQVSVREHASGEMRPDEPARSPLRTVWRTGKDRGVWRPGLQGMMLGDRGRYLARRSQRWLPAPRSVVCVQPFPPRSVKNELSELGFLWS